MLSKNKQKYIRSLKEKKHRDEYGVFVAEGNKLVTELLSSRLKCRLLVATPEFMGTINPNVAEEIVVVNDLSQVSFVKTPQQALAIFDKLQVDNSIDISQQLVLALDGIQDPGNMGTIIRLADWYGIKHIFCSSDTADVYNPKIVQATMGAIARVDIHYIDLKSFLISYQNNPIYGTLLDGDNIYEKEITPNGIIVMGNEGNGIRPEIREMITNKLFIPPYPTDERTSESLNVAIATAVICAEFRRRMM